MYKPLPPITESAPALQHRFRTEKAPQKRQRLQALYLLASGQAPSRLAIAELLAVHRHTVRAWLATYEAGGLHALLTIKQAPGKRSALTPAVRAPLQLRLRQPQGFGSYREIQQYLATEPHVPLAYRSGPGVVRYQLQANPKSPRRSHPKKPLPRSLSFNPHSRLSS